MLVKHLVVLVPHVLVGFVRFEFIIRHGVRDFSPVGFDMSWHLVSILYMSRLEPAHVLLDRPRQSLALFPGVTTLPRRVQLAKFCRKIAERLRMQITTRFLSFSMRLPTALWTLPSERCLGARPWPVTMSPGKREPINEGKGLNIKSDKQRRAILSAYVRRGSSCAMALYASACNGSLSPIFKKCTVEEQATTTSDKRLARIQHRLAGCTPMGSLPVQKEAFLCNDSRAAWTSTGNQTHVLRTDRGGSSKLPQQAYWVLRERGNAAA
jgi:hypothetical protein